MIGHISRRVCREQAQPGLGLKETKLDRRIVVVNQRKVKGMQSDSTAVSRFFSNAV